MTFQRTWSRRFATSSVGGRDLSGVWDDQRRAAAERIEADLADIDLVRVAFCDPHGLARSKTLSAQVFRHALRHGVDVSPGPFLFDTGHAVAVDFHKDPGLGVPELAGAGDMIVLPDPLTFHLLPHRDPDREPRTAWVLGDEYHRDGLPMPLSSRAVLRRVCEMYAERGLEPVVGLEVEWYLTRLLPGPPGNAGNGFGLQGEPPRVEAVDAGYQFNLDAYSDAVAPVVGPLVGMLTGLGLPLRTVEHESGPGQLEITFDPLPADEAADAMLLFRTLTKQYCARNGYHASFMALPGLDGADPSGWHIHQSVIGPDGRNLFDEGGPEPSESGSCRAYTDGLLAAAAELCLLSVPTVNGYHRFDPSYSLSPTEVSCRYEDRTALVRVLGGGESTHVETRLAEPCANPYLAIAAQLFAGLDGITGGDGPRAKHPAALPGSLRAALEAFRAGDRAEALLGKPLATCLARLKESEAGRYEHWCSQQDDIPRPTSWEHREYFAVY
ncbi:glutamine synthetase [Actinomadura graeca]|uniref:Glutamine synthetase n=1 Tax=Actinomadura graeca TaxID=2750812 RepID=A0ABX8QXD4_9ACTN|nr:glutamine synthetase family protein [Actinomadura graeca]QXJ22629.1 glutamine synthetase [Actinomadura graeca]